MQNLFLVLGCSLLVLSCGGYQGKSNPMSAEEIQIADLAQELEERSVALAAKIPEISAVETFRERAARFHNLSRRRGPNSLESRNAFDDLFYQRAQVDNVITEGSTHYEEWKKLREDYLLEIARRLGYKPGKSSIE